MRGTVLYHHQPHDNSPMIPGGKYPEILNRAFAYSVDSVESIEFVENYFVIFIFKMTKISILQNIQIS